MTEVEALKQRITELADQLEVARSEPRVLAKAIVRQGRGEPITVAYAMMVLRRVQSGELRR